MLKNLRLLLFIKELSCCCVKVKKFCHCSVDILHIFSNFILFYFKRLVTLLLTLYLCWMVSLASAPEISRNRRISSGISWRDMNPLLEPCR